MDRKKMIEYESPEFKSIKKSIRRLRRLLL